MSISLIPRYTNAVLDFDFKDNAETTTRVAVAQEEMDTFAERTHKLFAKSGANNLVLFGLGSGAAALTLAEALPDGARLIICETDTAAVRTFLETNPTWKEDEGRTCVIGDISLWAQFYLLTMSGATTESSHTVLNPELNDDDKARYQSLQRLFVSARSHQAINSSYLSHVAVQAPDMSVGVILNPEEPELDTFFAQFPDWVKEIVVVWDAEEVPETDFRCAAPIKHFAHPLTDFSEQRNRMLDECEGDWVLYLDGDELFSEDTWALFTALMLIKRLQACYFPRMTFYPEESDCKVGFGLWPDLQLRLFRNHEGVRFERPVHEKLTGIEGRVALALDAPILHYSRLRKTPEELVAKLKRFDEAADDRVQHLLNDDYPHIKRSRFPEASFIQGALQVMLLEENPA
ncbi:glycosyl transferase family 2 [Pseudodesulfovibrio sp. zrk46]|uniref:glycosyl transferase family 2 n=1 Tax=Pseudodesulfovibrio sp. zrk46 TaxID=2725288 RepID=UPI001448AEDB|nr:glycosyl transferase family 2 [Pseudodesulfovibrio sp. zrk46]QJB58123.1 glycosyl transferase family 2 [Pseudodesulfovibrio sp. zrk46]